MEKVVEYLFKVWIRDFVVVVVIYGVDLVVFGVVKFYKGIKKGDFVVIMIFKDEFVVLGKVMMIIGEMF